MMGPRVAVIGAGLSGLSAAQRLKRSGCSVVVFDKSRGPGGRLCTRRSPSGGFDHGAPYFHADSTVIKPWLDHGIIAQWSGRFGVVNDDGSIDHLKPVQRWVGVPKMSTIGRWMARSLNVHLSSRIEKLSGEPGRWTLTDTESHVFGPFDLVVVSCPGPQAAALLPERCNLYPLAHQMTYSICWAAMLDFDTELDLEWDGLEFETGPLAKAFRSNSKPGRRSDERWVLHAQAEWSETHQDHSPEAIGHALEQAFHPFARRHAFDVRCHRWLYAQSTQDRPQQAVIDKQYRLGLCGDGLTGGGVMDAMASGEHMADLVIDAMHSPSETANHRDA